MKRAALPLALFVAVGLASSRADAWCRATTDQDFVPTPTEPCDTTGVPLAWPGACVGFSLQKDASPAQNIDLPTATSVVDSAFAQWSSLPCFADNAACTGARTSTPTISAQDLGPVTCGNVESNDGAGNANVIVFRDSAWPYPDADITYALTTVQFYGSGEIVGADMEINSDPAYDHFTTSDTVVVDDLPSIVTHEAGHFLGLAHTQPANSQSTMYAEYRAGTTSLRTLADDDVCGICSAYPPERSATCDPTPRNGFAKLCGGVDLPLPSTSRCSCEVPGSSGAPIADPLVFTVLGALGWAAGRSRGRRPTRSR